MMLIRSTFTVKLIRNKNVDRLIFTHLNINNIRYKISMLSDIVAKKIDVLCISETKLDESFMSSNFLIPGYSIPFRRDRTAYGWGGGGGWTSFTCEK